MRIPQIRIAVNFKKFSTRTQVQQQNDITDIDTHRIFILCFKLQSQTAERRPTSIFVEGKSLAHFS